MNPSLHAAGLAMALVAAHASMRAPDPHAAAIESIRSLYEEQERRRRQDRTSTQSLTAPDGGRFSAGPSGGPLSVPLSGLVDVG